jgi:hypothetical protein
MLSTDHFRLVCLATVFCAFSSSVTAEEAHTETKRNDTVATTDTHPEEAGKSELVFEADPYYSNIGYNVPLTNKPIPTISSGSEAVIYRDLIEGSLIPRYMALEASFNPMPWLGTYIKSHSPSLFKQGEIGHTGINFIESATAGFPEPWAVSAFFGNVAKLQRPNETRHGNNYGYTGYLVSAGNKHIKDNRLIDDNWYELEWKIKGKIDYPDERLSWSFRMGGRINKNKDVNNITYISLHRSNLDFRYSFLEWLENTNYDLRMNFLQKSAEMVRLELIAGKKIPMPEWRYTPTLAIGFVWSSPNEYAGALKEVRGNTTTLVFRPSLEF